MKPNPAFMSNLQQALLNRNNNVNETDDPSSQPSTSAASKVDESNGGGDDCDSSKPVILLTNANGIESPGLKFLVEALVQLGTYNLHVCAPQSDKSTSGHSVTLHETVAVTSADIGGITAYEVTGTPVDCVSLALSGALFSWSKPHLVISGINCESSCGHHMLYSGVVAGAREALLHDVSSLSLSLNWKNDQSQEDDFKDAVTVCLPIISAAIRDIQNGSFPKSCFLNIEIPTSPSANKGFKLTKQSTWRSTPNWLAVSANRHPSAGYMSNQQSLGLQLAQLSRDASAAGAARRLTTQRKNIEVIESVGNSSKSDTNRVKKYFRLEFLEKEDKDIDEDLDFRALENGFVAITPVSLSPHIEADIEAAASEWISSAFKGKQ